MVALAALLAGLTAAVAAAAPQESAAIAKGQTIAKAGLPSGVPACSGCHGGGGEGQAASGTPRLAGLDAGYLDHQLTAFAAGSRDNPVMSPIAKMLDPDAGRDLGAYYASLPAPKALDSAAGDPSLSVGATLASRGDWAAMVPPCASCHGMDGLGVGADFPPLVGQSAAYIKAELTAWKAGTRHDDPLGLMKTVALRLSDDQIAVVAAYYATLPTGPATPVAAKGSTP